MTISIETLPYEELMEDNEIWKGWESTVIDENQTIITIFFHSNYRDRVMWVNGFFSALELNTPDLDEDWLNKSLWKGPETPLIGNDGRSNIEVWDWIVSKDDEKVLRVSHDDDADIPFDRIKRFATRAEAKNAKEINELVQELKRVEASNKASWDMYGSELCAGAMIGEEKAIEEKIEKLRNEL
jgi:hypothetical protein